MTKTEAQRLNLHTYIPNKPCGKGHSKRYGASGVCVECNKEYYKKYYQENKDKYQDYYQEHRDEILEYHVEYNIAHPYGSWSTSEEQNKKYKEYRKQYYLKQKGKK